eukprot:TRINITY_DN13481_c0_g4_i1.p1 TRINITY_DN13481_c0_g4~~TRINITY_DN13481_c0_g4_i1.p1  ORF type:complete len:1026 (-),score=365.41 TRINITY_DN13481_c0_g4_i1:176-3253(-)
MKILNDMNTWSPEVVETEVNWYYGQLGIHESYFQKQEPDAIARHIMSLIAAKILKSTSEDRLNLHIEREHDDRAMFVVPSHGNKNEPLEGAAANAVETQQLKDRRLENYIESQYLNLGYRGTTRHSHRPRAEIPFRMQVYRTEGVVTDENDDDTHLRLYFLQKPEFVNDPATVSPNETNIDKIGDVAFLQQVTPYTKELYRSLMVEAQTTMAPSFRILDTPKEHQKRLVLCFRNGTTHSLLSAMSDLYHYFKLRSSHKYVEPFANGMVIFSVYLCSWVHWHADDVNNAKSPGLPVREKGIFDDACKAVLQQAPMSFVLPRSALSHLLQSSTLDQHEVAYAYAGWKFAHQFLRRYADEQVALAKIIGDKPEHAGLLARLKMRLHKEVYTEAQIMSAISEYPQIIRALFKDFRESHASDSLSDNPAPGHGADALRDLVKKEVDNDFDATIFRAMIDFNTHVLKTNFFKRNKVALAFRLDPGFLSEEDVPRRPYGIFFIVGSEFLGFHIRFADVARGGIRVIRSSSREVYRNNLSTLFEENYNLAYTQQKKNKDIPEGGSKGTILLSDSHQDKAKVCFQQYIDAILDVLLLVKDNADEASDEAANSDLPIIDHYGSEEILFLGPDEGTADYMDWAALHARKRGASFWKAFTTGKSVGIGGIPHDLYGMTTRSVHQYVVGTLEKLDIDENSITKLQTGGPDGDLGSNEILISSDKTTTIIDGSGVLHDPLGINKEELTRLARARKMIDNFDVSKLNKEQGAFRVLVTERDVTLPDGTIVESGMAFRNGFHLNELATAHLFVPCGGRPKAVNASNVDQLLDEDGKPRFRVIVEGANLFFTQEARLVLSDAGCILFKDASANKGGVTSSSLEVLAALALTDAEFEEHMTVKDGVVPKFRAEYVQEVQNIIENNARMEFECIWKEHERTGISNPVLTDTISLKINDLNSNIITSSLWEKTALREIVFRQFVPKTLMALVPYATLMERVPAAYLRAIFGSYLAGRFVYQFGIQPSDFAFFEFVEQLSSLKSEQ